MDISYNTILIAIDGSDQSFFAFDKAVAMAKLNDAELHVVHVYDVRVYPSEYSSIIKRAESDGRDMLRKFCKRAEEQGVKAKSILKRGSPKVVISKHVAVDVGADLIVAGASGLYAVEQRLLGSVTDSIVRTAKCDVLVVRPDDE
ncbi:MAG TPA: universal stress protein [Bacillota bacterium]|nr:universal stress protein [Bacillota bacterium]